MGNELGDSGARRLARYAHLSAYHPFPGASDLSHDPRLQFPGQWTKGYLGSEGEIREGKKLYLLGRLFLWFLYRVPCLKNITAVFRKVRRNLQMNFAIFGRYRRDRDPWIYNNAFPIYDFERVFREFYRCRSHFSHKNGPRQTSLCLC